MIVQAACAVAGVAKRESGADGEVSVVCTACACEVQRRAPVVRTHLGMILGSTERLDPLGHAAMPLRTIGAGDLPVGDVADERMRSIVDLPAPEEPRSEMKDPL